jgi:hypothetical protein
MRKLVLALVLLAAASSVFARGSEHCYNGFNQEVDCGMPPPPDLAEMEANTDAITQAFAPPSIDAVIKQKADAKYEAYERAHADELAENMARDRWLKNHPTGPAWPGTRICVIKTSSVSGVCPLPNGPTGKLCFCPGAPKNGISQ